MATTEQALELAQDRADRLEAALRELRNATREMVVADAARATTTSQGMSRPAMVASIMADMVLRND